MTTANNVISRLVLLLCLVAFPDVCHGWWFSSWWETCFSEPPIGCFGTSEPFTNTGGIVPEDPAVIPTYFYYYRHGQPTRAFSVHNVTEVMRGRFQPSEKTVVIIHGYYEHARINWVNEIQQQLHTRQETVNIISVDWRTGASNVNYYRSVANTRVVGAVLALVIQRLQSLGADVSKFHLVGFSLGAHIAGYAGRRVGHLARITGLDPAGPAFEGTTPEVRLDRTDADFVDVIHTDATESVGLGTMQPMGDIDFYPNRALTQPGCPAGMLAQITAFFRSSQTSSALVDVFACSHTRAIHLFAASIANICPQTSPRSRSLQMTWRGGTTGPQRSSTSSNEWQRCENEENCPQMGYNIDPALVNTLIHQHMQENGNRTRNLLVTMETSGTWPYC